MRAIPTALFVLVFSAAFYHFQSPPPSPPYPPGSKWGSLYIPFIGETLDFMWDQFKFTKRFEEYNSRVIYSNPLLYDTAAVYGVEGLKKFYNQSLVKRHNALPSLFPELVGHTLLSGMDGALHHTRKGVINEMVADYGKALPKIEPIIEWHLNQWAKLKNFEWVSEFQALSVNVTMRLFIHDPPITAPGCGIQEWKVLLDDVLYALRAVPINLPFTPYHKGIKAREKIFQCLDAAIEDRKALLKQGQQPRDWLGFMVSKLDPSEGYTQQDIRVDANHMMLATYALYSVSSQMAAAFVEFPDVIPILRKEAQKSAASGALTLEKLNQLTEFKNLVMEVRRYYPVMAGMMGRTLQTFTVYNYTIPKDWLVASFYSTSHDPLEYQNPNKFDISRFNRGEPKHGLEYGYVPQGGGSHQNHRCAGDDLMASLKEMIAVHLMRDYTWTAPPQDLSMDTTRFHPFPMYGVQIKNFRHL